jgi:hypothetical protein
MSGGAGERWTHENYARERLEGATSIVRQNVDRPQVDAACQFLVGRDSLAGQEHIKNTDASVKPGSPFLTLLVCEHIVNAVAVDGPAKERAPAGP